MVGHDATLGISLVAIGVALLVYAYMGYAALLVLMTRWRRARSVEPGFEPRLSVVIAACNEEASIGGKLENTVAADYPPDKLDVVVVSDGSSDRTVEIVSEYARGDSRIRLVVLPQSRGKTQAQNEAVAVCTGDVVVFSDATTRYDSQALRYLAAAFGDESAGAVSGRYLYVDPKGKFPTSRGSIAFWTYENWIKKLQNRAGTLTGCSGCIYAVRKSLYEELPAEACSDLAEPLTVVRRGFRVAFEERALAFEDPTRSFEDEFRMRVRVIGHGMQSLVMMRGLLNVRRHGWVAFQLLSHKVARWLTPLYLVLILLGSLLAAGLTWVQWLLWMQAAFYLLGLVAIVVPPWRKAAPLSLPLYACTLSAAVVVSVWRLMRGHRYVGWTPVRSHLR